MTQGFTRAWVDTFGTACTVLEGGTGNRSVLVVAAFELAGQALTSLGALPAFKGRLVLCALEAQHQAPVAALLREQQPSAVLALEAIGGIANAGPALKLEAGEYLSSTGLQYFESGQIPAWKSPLELANALQVGSLAASLASIKRIPALACGPDSLLEALELLL